MSEIPISELPLELDSGAVIEAAYRDVDEDWQIAEWGEDEEAAEAGGGGAKEGGADSDGDESDTEEEADPLKALVAGGAAGASSAKSKLAATRVSARSKRQ